MRRALAAILLPLFACLATLGVGYAIKSRCTRYAWDGFQYRSSCYNDIYSLYSFRGLNEGKIPYIDGNGIDDGPDGDLEYPIGTGYVVMLVSAITDHGAGFFNATAVILAAAGLWSALLLFGLAKDRRRIYLYAIGPPLALYAFHNWDLLAVVLMCAGLVAYQRGSPNLSAGILGVGAATKVFPGVMLPALLLAEGRRTGRMPWKMFYSAAGWFAVVNLPILIANPAGFMFPWRFQGGRFPNFETHWYFLYRHLSQVGGSFWTGVYPRLTSIASALLFGAGLVWLIVHENRRYQIRPYTLAFMSLIMWLLTAKVYSPQFSLWLLPFFVIIAMPLRTYIGFVASDAAVWAAISFFFLAEQGTASAELRLWLVELATFARYVVLGWMLWHADRAEQLVLTEERLSDQLQPATV
ncbi:MAG: glycosyltransferase 87 family protein [Actinomycetota bacterium]